jgi:uncharacterized protein
MEQALRQLLRPATELTVPIRTITFRTPSDSWPLSKAKMRDAAYPDQATEHWIKRLGFEPSGKTRLSHSLSGASDMSAAKPSQAEQQWDIPWPCIHEFIAIVTSPAFKNHVSAWIERPQCEVLSDTDLRFSVLSGLTQRAQTKGGAVHDARIAAICLEHQVKEFWTLDRDFQLYPDLRTRNPLIASLHEPVSVYR